MHGVNIPLLREDADQLHWMQDWHQMKYVSRQAVNEHTQHQRGHCIIYHHKSHLSLEFPQFSYLYLWSLNLPGKGKDKRANVNPKMWQNKGSCNRRGKGDQLNDLATSKCHMFLKSWVPWQQHSAHGAWSHPWAAALQKRTWLWTATETHRSWDCLKPSTTIPTLWVTLQH